MVDVYICRAIPVSEDSRVLRYGELIEKTEHAVKYVQWGGVTEGNIMSAPIKRVRGNPLVNILLTPMFSCWLFFFLVRNMKKSDVVLAVDLDVALPALIAARFKGARIIFDIADPYSLCRFNRSIKIINRFEGWVAKHADLAIIPEKCRCSFYGDFSDLLIIENIPMGTGKYTINNRNSEERDTSKLEIGYFGNVEKDHRGLEKLIGTVLKRNDVILHIAGGGALSDELKVLSLSYPGKISYTGVFSPDELRFLAEPCSLLFAFYSLTKEHHQYVAANKLYEHLLLGKAILTNVGTNMESNIKEWGSGWAVQDSALAIDSFFDYVSENLAEIDKRGESARDVWEGKYYDYWTKSSDINKFLSFIG
jgi:hypothetical protein